MEKNINDQGTERAAIEDLLVKSAGTDIPLLLQAKERLKQLVNREPSNANLAALQRATTMLENAMITTTGTTDAPEFYKNTGAVLRYLQEAGRKIEKTKLYEDIKAGLLRKEKGGFRQRDIDKYGASLPLTTTPDGKNKDAEDRLRRKDEAEIRIKEAQADREEKKNKIIDGQYISKEQVYQELAARAVALNMSLKSEFRAGALDMIIAVGGDQQKTELLVRELEKFIDTACNAYSRELQIEVNLHALDDGDDGEDSE